MANGVASTEPRRRGLRRCRGQEGQSYPAPKDLAGKKIAVNTQKNIGDTTVRESVRKDGGDPSNIKFVEMPFANMPAALEKGDIDAAWVVEPSLAVAKDMGARVVAWNFVDAAPTSPSPSTSRARTRQGEP